MENDSIKNKLEIKNINVFYSNEDASEFVKVELISGNSFNIEGKTHEIKIGKKYLQSNVFIMDNDPYIYHNSKNKTTEDITPEYIQKLIVAIQKYNAKQDAKIKIWNKEKFEEFEDKQEQLLEYEDKIKYIENVEIAMTEIILEDYFTKDMIFKLNSGERFAIDGRLIYNYVDGIVQYTNIFVVQNGIYPCDKDGFGITDRAILHNEYVNKGFLYETVQRNERIDYELTPEFNKAITEAIHIYNQKPNAKIKIFTETEYAKLEEKNGCDKLPNDILELFQPNTIVTVYSYEESKTITGLVNEVKKKADNRAVTDDNATTKLNPVEYYNNYL